MKGREGEGRGRLLYGIAREVAVAEARTARPSMNIVPERSGALFSTNPITRLPIVSDTTFDLVKNTAVEQGMKLAEAENITITSTKLLEHIFRLPEEFSRSRNARCAFSGEQAAC